MSLSLPDRPLSTWTPEERGLHAGIIAAIEVARGETDKIARDQNMRRAKDRLARLNARLAARGARCGYQILTKGTDHADD